MGFQTQSNGTGEYHFGKIHTFIQKNYLLNQYEQYNKYFNYLGTSD